jgi:membrane associated rhomboid family serine protease
LIPYKDDNPTATFPFVTIAFIVINILVFLWQVATPEGLRGSVFAYGAVPVALLKLESQQPLHPVATIFTSMFMHGGILHIAGNMLYLWIFGNNIEDKLGHYKFIIFYLLGGVVAAYAHAISSPGSNIPMVGASGAVAAVLGSYLLLFLLNGEHWPKEALPGSLTSAGFCSECSWFCYSYPGIKSQRGRDYGCRMSKM